MTSPRCCSTRTRRARGTRTSTTSSCRPTRRCCRTRPAPQERGTSSCIRRSGSGWRCATTSPAPEFTHAPCTPDSDTQHLRRHEPGGPGLHRQASGHGVPGAAVLPARLGALAAGCQLRRHAVVRRDGDLQLQLGSEQRRQQQRLVPEQRRRRAGELRLRHQERRSARTRRHRSSQTNATFTPNSGNRPVHELGRQARRSTSTTASAGLTASIHDRTTGQTGSMTASAANGFAQVPLRARLRAPATRRRTRSDRCTRPRASTRACRGRRTATTSPSPTRSATSSTARRSPARAATASPTTRARSTTTTRAASARPSRLFVPIGGCIASDADFDGTSYQTGLAGHRSEPRSGRQVPPDRDHVHEPALQRDAELQPRRVRGRPSAHRGA